MVSTQEESMGFRGTLKLPQFQCFLEINTFLSAQKNFRCYVIRTNYKTHIIIQSKEDNKNNTAFSTLTSTSNYKNKTTHNYLYDLI